MWLGIPDPDPSETVQTWGIFIKGETALMG